MTDSTNDRSDAQASGSSDMGVDVAALQPGMVLRYIPNGSIVVLDRRKEDDSGWWNTDGSGLADSVIRNGDWKVVHRQALTATDYERLLDTKDQELAKWNSMYGRLIMAAESLGLSQQELFNGLDAE